MEEQKPDQNQPKTNISIVIISIIITAIIVAAIFYFWQQSDSSTNTSSTNTIANTAAANTNTGSQLSREEVITAFQDAVNIFDYDMIESLLAERVYFVLQSTECCGDITRAEAMASMDYLEGGIYYIFDQNQQIVKSMKVNYPETFGVETIGISENGGVISFRVNDQNKVDRVYMSVSHELLDLE